MRFRKEYTVAVASLPIEQTDFSIPCATYRRSGFRSTRGFSLPTTDTNDMKSCTATGEKRSASIVVPKSTTFTGTECCRCILRSPREQLQVGGRPLQLLVPDECLSGGQRWHQDESRYGQSDCVHRYPPRSVGLAYLLHAQPARIGGLFLHIGGFTPFRVSWTAARATEKLVFNIAPDHH